MTTGMVQDQNLEKHIEKQMGCMAGFLQIFDRHQILAGKRLYSAKRLPPSVSVDSPPESEKSVGSPTVSRELEKHHNAKSTPSPDRLKKPPVAMELRSPVPENHNSPASESLPPKSPLPLPVFDFKEGTRTSWKFAREAPRLSLDSRATVDAKGSLYPREIRTNAAILSANRCENSTSGEDDCDNQRRSPSVIARLMGLEPLQHSDPEPVKKAELRRSASESRVSKDLYQYRFVDGNAFSAKQQTTHANFSGNVVRDNAVREDRSICKLRQADPKAYVKADPTKAQHHKGIGQRKSYFDSADFFPEPKQTSSVYSEIEKRLKMRGIDEPAKDLETLKQILEALQLKGLLHSRAPASNQIDYRNFVYDRSFSNDESPIVVMKPVRYPAPTSRSPRFVGNDSPPPSSSRSRPTGDRRNLNPAGDALLAVSPRRDRRDIDRSTRNQSPSRYSSSPVRSESCVSPNRRRPLSIEVQRKGNDIVEHRRVSPVHSPKLNSRRIASEQQQTPNRSPRNRKPTAEMYRKETKVLPPVEDESSTMSEGTISTSTDTERAKVEEYKEGRSLLERCDKLLHSIAEITTTNELQSSPVSVLDSSFYKDESSTSPVMKRAIDFKDQPNELEDETIWGSALSSSIDQSEVCDLVYISEIVRASNYLPEDSDIFLLLEKQQHLKGNDTSKVSRLQRRLIFDTITEILDRNRKLPPWKVVSPAKSTSLQQIWSEFRRIRERDESEDLFQVICGVLRKDLEGDAVHGWGDCPVEVSEAVLDIERLIFKDLIGETIRDLATFSVKSYKPLSSCRKLVF
ncbi:hypothetical protein L484_012545 [Morus notabilis]|uniref:DUF4378 domain-containing protein n=1 Tax=Morus notabilis TaxID=981085 RepID=W9QCN4_9ROSA|nr:protein LONGIFOLIA 1 [Morus notabilis]EXB26554.1 hypothetical protein L484_012545 [Morus notabilis]